MFFKDIILKPASKEYDLCLKEEVTEKWGWGGPRNNRPREDSLKDNLSTCLKP